MKYFSLLICKTNLFSVTLVLFFVSVFFLMGCEVEKPFNVKIVKPSSNEVFYYQPGLVVYCRDEYECSEGIKSIKGWVGYYSKDYWITGYDTTFAKNPSQTNWVEGYNVETKSDSWIGRYQQVARGVGWDDTTKPKETSIYWYIEKEPFYITLAPPDYSCFPPKTWMKCSATFTGGGGGPKTVSIRLTSQKTGDIENFTKTFSSPPGTWKWEKNVTYPSNNVYTLYVSGTGWNGKTAYASTTWYFNTKCSGTTTPSYTMLPSNRFGLTFKENEYLTLSSNDAIQQWIQNASEKELNNVLTLPYDFLKEKGFDAGLTSDQIDASIIDARIKAEAFPPKAPTGLTAYIDDNSTYKVKIGLDWQDNKESDFMGYNVYRKKDNGSWTKLTSTPISTSSYTNVVISGSGTYYYYVTAIDLTGHESPASNIDEIYPVDGSVVYAINSGEPIPSEYLIHRTGYMKWGTEPEQSIDYDPQEVTYRLPNLDSNKEYILGVSYIVPDTLAITPVQNLKADNIPIHTNRSVLSTSRLLTHPLPKSTYKDDGEVILHFERVDGEFVSVDKIFLWEKNEQSQPSPSIGNKMVSEEFTLNQNYPNPFNPRTTISYQIPVTNEHMFVSLNI